MLIMPADLIRVFGLQLQALLQQLFYQEAGYLNDKPLLSYMRKQRSFKDYRNNFIKKLQNAAERQEGRVFRAPPTPEHGQQSSSRGWQSSHHMIGDHEVPAGLEGKLLIVLLVSTSSMFRAFEALPACLPLSQSVDLMVAFCSALASHTRTSFHVTGIRPGKS